MERRVRLHAVLPIVMALAINACASSKPAPPAADPVKEQVFILQKQLLELQRVQIETKQKLDEQTALTETLSSRLKAVEEQRSPSSRLSSTVSGTVQTNAQTSSLEKKKQKSAAKKKKKKSRPVRRQEQ